MQPPSSNASFALRPQVLKDAIHFRFGNYNTDFGALEREHADLEIKVLHKIEYETFWADCMVPNKPVLLTGETESWKARRDWVLQHGHGSEFDTEPTAEYEDALLVREVSRQTTKSSPNFERLQADFGEEEVCIAICGEQFFSDQRREDVRMADFLREWQAMKRAPITANSACEDEDTAESASSDSLQRLEQAWSQKMREGGRLPYCKDWHFAHRFRNYGAYELPVHFSEDWLNAYYDAHPELGDDYRFCYLGPAGSWTPLHRDVLRSYSWSANICGRKLWIMFPPSQDHLLRDARGNLPWDVTAAVDAAQFPDFHQATPLRVLQQPGDIIFVPSGWLHQVLNLDDCVSINHNWLNSCNIRNAVAQMRADHSDAARSIDHCRGDPDFPAICEKLLQAHAGMNLAGFHGLLVFCCEGERRRAEALLAQPCFAAAAVLEPRGAAASAPESSATSEEEVEEAEALAVLFRVLALQEAFAVFEQEEHVRLLAQSGQLEDSGYSCSGGAPARLQATVNQLRERWPKQWSAFPSLPDRPKLAE